MSTDPTVPPAPSAPPGRRGAPPSGRARIVVLGSANMDLAAYTRVAPARGETVTGEAFRTVAGGKGANQAIAAARAGGEVTFVGAVGDDDFGPRLRAALDGAGVGTGPLRTVPGPSGIAHIVVDGEGHNAIVVVPGANGTVTSLADGDEDVIAAAGALLLQLELPLDGVLAGARAAHRHGVRTVLTPAPAQPLPGELLAVTDLLVPNEHEAAALSGHSDPRAAARALLDAVPEVVVTLGAAGCLYAARGHEPLVVPALPAKAVDTTAAGDTFVGALAVALGEGRPVPAALEWATAASALSVEREGASSSMPERAEIDARAAGGTPVSRRADRPSHG
ncbi:ribokinase [Streptomyces sp. NBC_00669]|uniref:ribokinase n=1 Tax=unclassified Streptomyces TaxID=2593676 RepID=UPI002E365FA8|nr:ribokinase [Streptomyces sp. NBC_00669]